MSKARDAETGFTYVRDTSFGNVTLVSFTPDSIMDAPSGMLAAGFVSPRTIGGITVSGNEKQHGMENGFRHGIPPGFIGGFVPEAKFI